MSDSICEIPLYARDGSVRAVTRVDPDDWFTLARYRWFLSAQGYAVGRLSTPFLRDGRRGPKVAGGSGPLLSMHRYLVGSDEPRKVDHINRDRLDNRRANLRLVNDSQHAQNQTPQTGRTSAYRGVSWDAHNDAWRATAGLNGRHIALGYFADEDKAATAAAEFRTQHMPFSAEGMASA